MIFDRLSSVRSDIEKRIFSINSNQQFINSIMLIKNSKTITTTKKIHLAIYNVEKL